MCDFTWPKSCSSSCKTKLKKPNFLFILVDELRAPVSYQNDALKQWSKENLIAMQELKDTGVNFLNHYTAATACSPSRASIFTGQYPSLHGVTQTTGIAKERFEPDEFWLDPNTVPTLGHYFKEGGYDTYYKGKWHASAADINIPDTQNPWSSYDSKGIPASEPTKIYLNAQRLKPFGFSDWIGPEPHGSNPRNSGASAGNGLSGRDVVFAEQTASLIEKLDQDKKRLNPWFIACSFVNPHDLTLYGDFTEFDPAFNFEIDPTLPFIPPAPTANEDLKTKPRAQASYREIYPEALQPTKDSLKYRQLYYSLQKKVDMDIQTVLKALKKSRFSDNTIVIFTSDHGDMLGAHGGLFQKWKVSYNEAIHIPFIIQCPSRFPAKTVSHLTSHVDLLPTLLNLAGISIPETQLTLRASFSEVHSFVGKDLTSMLTTSDKISKAKDDIIYFMTDDDPFTGSRMTSILGKPFSSVREPAHLETIVTRLGTQLWKLTRYFDNPQFWSEPGEKNVQEFCRSIEPSEPSEFSVPLCPSDTVDHKICEVFTKIRPRREEFEMYNLTEDPYEETNLAHPTLSTPESKIVEFILRQNLIRQCQQKRLTPRSGPVPGLYQCPSSFVSYPRQG